MGLSSGVYGRRSCESPVLTFASKGVYTILTTVVALLAPEPSLSSSPGSSCRKLRAALRVRLMRCKFCLSSHSIAVSPCTHYGSQCDTDCCSSATRFEKKVNLRKFDKYVTDAQIRLDAQKVEETQHNDV